ncbi:FkbM family methyltransferase [Candidatus Pelagibacter sp.]|jgi:FkbM family methyltransferase|nr:FkbM family methyltransferase [Candidatus Pelagibacter sp.]
MKSQKITTLKKKKALDKFDKDNFSDNRTLDSEILNQVGKINVGWNINYLRSLPKPNTIIDVGSADDFHVLHDAYPEAFSIFVDPNLKYEDIYKNYLKKKSGEYHMCGVSNKSYTDKYYHYPDKPYLSSLIRRNDVEDIICEEKEIKIMKLDEIINFSKIKKNILLKIDAEGSEVNILNGSKKLLNLCNTIICECSLDDTFPGGYTISEIVKILSSFEFKIKDIIRVPRKEYNSFPAEVLDIVFVKN